MKKWTLILFISFWIFLMVAVSGDYNSSRTAVAWYRYHTAPSEMTLKEFQDAKRSDRWHILVCELILGGVLVWPVIALIHLSKRES
jgi:hypothetical protein